MPPPLPCLALAKWDLTSIFATQISANLTVVLATLGLCLIFFELNRPGRILPGSLGLLLFLYAVSQLSRHALQPWAVALSLLCSILFLLNLWRPFPLWILVSATLGLILGFRFLLGAGNPVSSLVAVACGGLLGVLAASLTRIAFRARRLKAVD